MQEAVFTKCQGKTVTTESEQETARALSGIMRRNPIREKKLKKPLREREREGGKRVVRWVGDGKTERERASILLLGLVQIGASFIIQIPMRSV